MPSLCYNKYVSEREKSPLNKMIDKDSRKNQKGIDTMSNTTANHKPTQRDYFNRLLSIPAVANDNELVEFIESRIAQLDKKNSAERKPTAKQTENAGFKSDIVAWMESGVSYALADIHKGVPSIVAAGISPNRVTAMMTQLVNDGLVVRDTLA